MGGARRVGRGAVSGTGRVKSFVVRRPWLVGLVLGMLVLTAVVYSIALGQHRNHQAIEKNCILLNNLIIKSSAPSGRTQVLIEEIIKLAKDNGDTKFLAGFQSAPANSDIIKYLVDCKQVADHPEQIHQEQLGH